MKTIKAWGKEPASSLPYADNFCCPHCKKFSFFCNGDFTRHAATIWRESVTGFFPKKNGMTDQAGTVTLVCQHCSQIFGLMISNTVLGIYQDQCPKWPSEQKAASR